jgi:hypothetical protein
MPESFFHLSAKEQEEALQVAASASGSVEHKTFSVKADYIRKIDYSAPNEASEDKAAKPAKKAK